MARIALPASANASAQAGCGIARSDGANQTVTRKTPPPTTRPRAIAPSTYAANSSAGDSGGSSTKIRLPVIFDWISDEDEFAKLFCSTDIMTSPGTRNSV